MLLLKSRVFWERQQGVQQLQHVLEREEGPLDRETRGRKAGSQNCRMHVALCVHW